MVTYNEKDKFQFQRTTMVKTHLKARDITDPAVLRVFAQVPREEFIPEKYLADAYADRPVPIGLGQTISQPYIVALMTQCLRLNKDCNVLEIGTGSGYQTAILAQLARHVYTVERLNQLAELAQTVIGRLNITNVEFAVADGSLGYPDTNIKFDRIIVTAAIPKLPTALAEQLKENGIIVAPVGGQLSQELIIYEKIKNKLNQKFICGCRFVKLIGKNGFDEE